MIRKIVIAFFGICLMFLGVFNLLIHFEILPDVEKEQCIELVETGGTAIATYDIENSKERVKKIKGIPTSTTYIMKYFFDVNGEKIFGEQTTEELPQNLKTRVTYLKNNPKINMINPQAKLAELNKLRASTGDILSSLFKIVLGLFMFLALFIDFKKKFNRLLGRETEDSTKKTITSSDKVVEKSSRLGAMESNNNLPPPPRFQKESKKDSKETKPNKRTESVRRKRPEKEVPATIKRDELLANSKKDFKETDHSRFIPPSMRLNSEEE